MQGNQSSGHDSETDCLKWMQDEKIFRMSFRDWRLLF